MSRYNDDQCERCGYTRVAESTLCAACLVKERAFLEKEILIKGVAVEMLKGKLETQTELLDNALSYGFKQNRKVMTMEGMIRELRKMVQKGGKDGKDR